MHTDKVELFAIIIGMLLIGTSLFRNKRPRTDGSRYYKIDKGSRE